MWNVYLLRGNFSLDSFVCRFYNSRDLALKGSTSSKSGRVALRSVRNSIWYSDTRWDLHEERRVSGEVGCKWKGEA
jgi:hypothetical protein